MAGLAALSAQTQQITLEDIWTKRTFAPRGVYGIRSMADGEHYCTMSRTGITQYSYATGEETGTVCPFGAGGSLKAKPNPVFEGYELSQDEQRVLLSSGFEPIYRHSGVSDYTLYDRRTQRFTKLSANGKQRLTTFSPDGTKVAFVRDNNLYWMDLETLEEHAVTTDGRLNEVINGTTDWVYEEEFAITEGFRWSPDSRQIAFMRFDESRVKEYNMQMWGELYPEDYRYKYPKAGEENSRVELRVYKLDGGTTQRLRLGGNGNEVGAGSEWEYVPRFQWVKAGMLAAMRMNRLQNEMEILAFNTDGEGSDPVATLYSEANAKAYVEVPDTWRFVSTGKGKKARQQMLITSERDGFRHIYLCDLDGKQLQPITSGSWEVCAVEGVDTKNGRLYYTSREDGAINKTLYVVGLDGKGKKRLGDQVGTYGAAFSEGCKYYIQTYSDANSAPVYTLHDAKGRLIKTLEDNAALQQKMAEYGTGRKQFGSFTTARGTELNYYTVKPANFDAGKKYPVLIYVYGGPGNQQVANSYGYGDYYWYHMLADRGYVVFCFDGRGTGGRGAEFKKQTYGDMGRMECEDAIEAARWLGSQEWVDAERIGIWGWSFGGYLSTLSMLKGEGVFKAAIAVAPVMNWRYYDNIYTERYLGLPQQNAQGYDQNSPLNFAQKLQGNYLLIHGTGDDNVHFQNSAEMVDRLEKAGKQFEFRIYPNKNHSIYDNTGKTRLNLYQLMTDFIERKL